jgi:site-specific DNA recombinase
MLSNDWCRARDELGAGGEAEYSSKNGNHETLVSRELFYRVQARIEKKITGKAKKHSFLLAGLMTCDECGRSICAEVQKGFRYYRCTRFETACTQRSYSREEKLEEQILTFLEGLHIKNDRLAAWLKKALQESHVDEMEYHNSAIQELNGRFTKQMQKVDTLYDEKLEGNITPEFYERKFAQYSQELDDVTNALQRHKNANLSYIELGASILDLTQRAREIYAYASPEKKRKLLSIVFAGLRLKDKTLVPDYNKAFQFIRERVEVINTEDSTYERLPSSKEAVILESAQNFEPWLRGLDDVRTVLLTGKSHFSYKILMPELVAA